MTYEELKKKYPHKFFTDIQIKREFTEIGIINQEVKDLGWEMSLGHPIDGWYIGGIKQAKTLLKNLQDAISYCENNP